MSVVLSEDAKKLLRQVVALKEQYSGGWVPDRILWEAAKLGPAAYDPAAEELIANQLAKSYSSDPATLKATSEGIKLARGV